MSWCFHIASISYHPKKVKYSLQLTIFFAHKLAHEVSINLIACKIQVSVWSKICDDLWKKLLLQTI